MEYCNRPFDNTNIMDAAIIGNWNKVVEDRDLVYVLGDIAFGSPTTYIEALKGKKYIIRGNHDKYSVTKYLRYPSVIGCTDLRTIKVDDTKITLCHYPLCTWPGMNEKNLHFHGHSHGTLKMENRYRLDVGVDNIGFSPIKFEEARALVLGE